MKWPDERGPVRLTLDWDDEEDAEKYLHPVRTRADPELDGLNLGDYGVSAASDVWERWRSANHGRVKRGSSTEGTGEHYIEWDAVQSIDEAMGLRRRYGDDGNRIGADAKRLKAGTPFYGALWDQKGILPEDYPPHATPATAERFETHGFDPDAERTKDGRRVDWQEVARLAAEHAGGNAALGNLLQSRKRKKWSSAPRKVVYNWVTDNRNDPAPASKAQLRRYAKKHSLGHYSEEGEEPATVPGETVTRRHYSEGLTVPWIVNWGYSPDEEDESEDAPLTVRVGYFGDPEEDESQTHEEMPDRKELKQYHEAVMDHVTDLMAPGAGEQEPVTRAKQSLEEKPMRPGEARLNVENVLEFTETDLNPETLSRSVFIHIVLWEDEFQGRRWTFIGLAGGPFTEDAAEVPKGVRVLHDDPPEDRGKSWW